MKNTNRLFILSVSLSLAFNAVTIGQISNKINPDWTNNSDWNGGSAPQYNTQSSATLNHNSTISAPLIINAGHTISVNNGKTLSTSQSITIKDGGQLLIIGTLDGTQSGMDLIIEQGGRFIMQAGSSVDWDGNVFISGDLSIASINGSLEAGGNFEVDNNAIVSGNGDITVYGTLENRGIIFGCNSPFDQCCSGTPCFLSARALPVELVNLKAKHTGISVVVNWITASEINNDYFDVERSADNEIYDPIIRVDGAGNSTTTLFYSAEDKQPILHKSSFYRLRQTDYDGAYSISDPVMANFRENYAPEIFLYPNPCMGEKINILVLGNENEYELEIILYDPLGKNIFSQISVMKSCQVLSLDLAEVPADGIYGIIIKNGNRIFQKKIAVIKPWN